MRRLTLYLGMCVLLLFSSCTHKAHHSAEPMEFLTTNPIQKDTSLTKDYVCQIHSIKHIEIRALEKGYLQELFVDEGQHITKGQKMFKIMPNIYQAELQKAQAEARIAEIEYANTKLLADNNVVSPNELALALAELEKKNAEVKLAQTHLNFTDINAPFDGIMDHLHLREGSLVDEGELLTTLSDNSTMWVYFNVPESEYLDYITNSDGNHKKSVNLLMANQRLFNEPGVVETIEGEFDNKTGNIAFRASFSNPKGILRHGETGSILMKIPLTNAILIPQKATFEILDKRYVFVVDKNNEVHQREIEVSTELPHLFVVSKGLSTEDQIIYDGIRKVKDGDQIHSKFNKPAEVYSHLEMYSE